MARCLADVIQTHSGTKVYIEQTIPGLARVVNDLVEHARMDLVFDQSGITTYIDVPASLLHPVPDLVTSHINLVSFILESTGRLGYHAKKFIHQHPHERC